GRAPRPRSRRGLRRRRRGPRGRAHRRRRAPGRRADRRAPQRRLRAPDRRVRPSPHRCPGHHPAPMRGPPVRGGRPLVKPTPRSVAALVIGVLALAPATAAHAGQGTGHPSLAVSAPTLPTTGVSDITVTGTDYLVPPHAPGASVFG